MTGASEETMRSRERREYFRIDDEVMMDYRIIQEDEVAEVMDRIEGRKADRFTAVAELSGNSREMSRLLSRIGEQSPEISRYLQNLDYKLNMLARIFLTQELEEHQQSMCRVNLSAGGLAFDTSRSLAVGDTLELRLLLLPAGIGILTVARVVYSEKLTPGCGPCGNHVAVEYVGMRESDRDLVVKHILATQNARLRSQREESQL